MAAAETYDQDELPCLDLLICTTNRNVCKHCLSQECNGACDHVSDAMISAKDKYFSDGLYEQVLLVKEDRQVNDQFGHSPFSRDSYLSTRPTQESEGADTYDDPPEQEDISILSKTAPRESEAEILQIEQDETLVDYESESSVEEDSQN